MDILLTVAGAAVMVAMAAYVVNLSLMQWRVAALARGRVEDERTLLKERIAQLALKRQFEEQRNELSWSGFRKFEVVRKVLEGGGVASIYMRPHDGKKLPPFRPGQYLTFRLNVPGQRQPVIRCYSLSDNPNPEHFRISVKKVLPPRDKPDVPSGLSSTYFNDVVKEGDIIDVKAPGGGFYLDTTKPRPIVLIGGGIGLTPVFSMLKAVCESSSKQEAWFFYGVRNRVEHIWRDEFSRIARENENVRLHVCYSDPTPECHEGTDYQHAARVGVDLLKRLLPSNNYEFYICGPPPMMDSITSGLAEWGVPEDRVHFEAFGPATVKKVAKAAEAPVAAPGAPTLQVLFAKSGRTVRWDGRAASLLELAEANGITIDFGCRAGNCGTCLTAIKNGDVSYVNPPGSMPEKGSCLTCVSVPKSDLTLDA
ncbi:MAG: 2Fe-2S iron-sulfur cluster binding domain-containing protein [Proteobacteria bacterium]|nr:2Fe-2S iron-sulfur cluster binding domain-containing protein [Pseudomonadota bacterium]